nr:hypothetical protein [Tanacetum cinerariifolium]
MKRKKSSKEVESSKDPRSKESKPSSSSKGTSCSQHKSSGKSAHVEEPCHTVDDSGISDTHGGKPPISFDELMDTPIKFYAFVMNRLNITNLTKELLVGSAFNLLKGTCKSLTELEYHFEECSKATTERLDWHNPKGKPYPFDLYKPLPLIPDHRDRNNRNRLMHIDELHKFSDGTLDSVRTTLHDIALGIRIEYLPKKKWSRFNKRRARVMIQDIKKQLFQIRLMRNLDKFIGGREYREDLRLLERII